MADQEENAVDQEKTESETLNLEQTEESSEEESEVPEGEEESEQSKETEETSEEDTQETELDWDEWKTQEDLPKDIDSPEALAASYKESLTEMKKGQTATQRLAQVEQMLKTQGFQNGVDGLLGGGQPQQALPQGLVPQQQQQQQAKTYFQPNPASAVIDAMVKGGGVASEQEPNFRSLASVVDKAINPQFELAEKVMTEQGTALNFLYTELRKMQWNQLDPKLKSSIDRTQADSLIAQGFVADYDEAAKWMAFKVGNVLGDAVNKAEKRGRDNAKKKLRRGGKAIRKGREDVNRSYDFEKYRTNGDWDLNKLMRLPDKESDAVLQAYAKKHG